MHSMTEFSFSLSFALYYLSLSLCLSLFLSLSLSLSLSIDLSLTFSLFNSPSHLPLFLPSSTLSIYTSFPFTPVEIGFTRHKYSVPEGSNSNNICVAISKPEANNDIEPSLAIPISKILENATSNSKLFIISPRSNREYNIILCDCMHANEFLMICHETSEFPGIGIYN